MRTLPFDDFWRVRHFSVCRCVCAVKVHRLFPGFFLVLFSSCCFRDRERKRIIIDVMATKVKVLPTIPAADHLAQAFRLIDGFNATRGIGAGDRKRQRSEATTLGGEEGGLQEGLELLTSIMTVHRSHLLPSCDVISRRLLTLLPTAVDKSTFTGASSMTLWQSVSIFVGLYGAAAAKVLTEVFLLALEEPSAEGTTSLRAYFGSEDAFAHIAEAITAGGAFMDSSTLQLFALRFVSEYCPLFLATKGQDSNQKQFLRALLPVAELTLALLLVCRPFPPPLLVLSNGLLRCMSSCPPDALFALHRLKAATRLLTLPESLPWYTVPSDSVVTTASVSRAAAAPPLAALPLRPPSPMSVPVTTVSMATLPAPTYSTGSSHPALQSSRPANTATHASPKAKDVKAHATSPATHTSKPSAHRPTSKRGTPSTTAANGVDDMPDIILD